MMAYRREVHVMFNTKKTNSYSLWNYYKTNMTLYFNLCKVFVIPVKRFSKCSLDKAFKI